MADMQLTAPVPTGLPALPPPGLTSDAQWRVLMSLMDTVVPTVRRQLPASDMTNVQDALSISTEAYETIKSELQRDGTDTSSLDAFLEEKPSNIPLFGQLLQISLAGLPEDARWPLLMVLSLLSTRAGSLLLTGHPTPFDQLSVAARTQVINRWRLSWLTPLKTVAKALTALAVNGWTRSSPTLDTLMGLPAVPIGWKPVPSHDFEFLQFPPAPSPAELDTDIVIVGSGCGAGVSAANLAAAGHRVVVVDKGYFFPSSAFPMSGAAAYNHLFEAGGLVVSDDGSVTAIAGSCWGGGGTVNWSASLQTQGFVRKEWAEERGLEFFQTQAFQDGLDRVCQKMGAKEGPQNHGNRVLLDGARKLGWHAKAIPQNTRGCDHDDGLCSFGCWRGEKQGPTNFWLPEAAKYGARFVEGLKVDRVVFDGTGKNRRAVGVVGTWTSRALNGNWDGPISERRVKKVLIRAKRVIVSCGTLQSPLLLMRSGIKNKLVGRNLHLHPVTLAAGIFEEDVRPWEGGCLTSVVTTFEDLDGKGHGAKLEALSMMNWTNGADFKSLALKYRHMNCYFTLVRDRDTGYVYPDPKTGNVRMVYAPSAFDLKSTMVGLVALAKILYIEGATEIHVGLPGLRPFLRNAPEAVGAEKDKGVRDPAFQKWLGELESYSIRPPGVTWAAAHQMGTCRMSSKEKEGVVDPKGRVWETQGLYVADASVFPSASGVNPMVTNLAISDMISRNIAEDLTRATVIAKL